MSFRLLRRWLRFKRFVRDFPPFYPLLAGAYPVLAIYSLNIDQLWPSALLKPLATILGGVVVFWAISAALFRGGAKGAVFALAGTFVFFAYGYAADILSWLLKAVSERSWGVFLLAPALLFMGLLARRLRRSEGWGELTLGLNAASAVLITFPLLSIGFHPASHRAPAAETALPPALSLPRSRGLKPDIYFILLDAYGRRDVLRNLFHYDNGWFLKELSKRGFQVCDASRSNYAVTFLSLAATLNMRYLDEVFNEVRRTTVDRDLPTLMIRENAVQGFLKKQGYRVVHLTSGWAVTNHNPGADVQYGSNSLQEFLSILYRPTLWGTLFPNHIQNGWRELIFNNLSALNESASLPGPKFVFAHFVCPHEPFVFYPDGGDPRPDFVKQSYRERWTKRRRYLGNLIFISRRILKGIDRIRASSAEEPVIIIESDHGPATQLSTRGLPASKVHERMSNLIALRLPGPDAPKIPADFTPVNTFRVVFDRYFGTRLGLLANRSYYCDPATPYQSVDASTCCSPANNPFTDIPPEPPMEKDDLPSGLED